MKQEILKSKYLKMTLLFVVLICGCLFGLTQKMSANLSAPTESIYEELEGKAQVVIPFEEGYSEIHILNGEKGYFAVRARNEEGRPEYRVVDLEGTVLLETGVADFSGKGGDYALFSGKDVLLVNTQNLETKTFSLAGGELHENGEYLLGEEAENRWLVIRTKDGRTLCESEDPLEFPQKTGYAITRPTGDYEPQSIINLATGKVEYTSARDEMIADGNREFWTIRKGTAAYVLDGRTYEPALDSRVFRDVKLADGIVFGTWIEDTYMDSLDEVSGDGSYWVPDWRAYNRSGDEVYQQEVVNVNYLGNAGNTAVLWNTKTESYQCCIIGQNGVEKEYTCEDFYYYPQAGAGGSKDGDGTFYMAACQNMFGSDERIKPSKTPKQSNSAHFLWTYVDESMTPISSFLFRSASTVENGYGVVGDAENRAALLDLYRRGEQ